MADLVPTHLMVKCPKCGKVTSIRTKVSDTNVLCRGKQGLGYCTVVFHVHLGFGTGNLRVTVNDMTIKPLHVDQ